MFSKTKVNLFLILFFFTLLSYLLLLFFFPHSFLAQLTNIFQSTLANFIFVVFFFMLIVLLGILGLSGLVDFFYGKLLKKQWQRTKLGKILVVQEFITKRELEEALSEQGLKIGEVLVQSGRITSDNLNEALVHQREVPQKLGCVLKEIGSSTDEDIKWALSRMGRKLGEILMDKGLITNYELYQALTLQRYGKIPI
ncbi:MAG: hypothetical protein SWO11_21220 [Thermodesulfobacteriota bacterium]|nr:hypothetical protein [Thermodesulfobacteriota bacterium]